MKKFFKHTMAVVMVLAAMFMAMAFSSALADEKVEGSVAHTEATMTQGSTTLTDTIDALQVQASAGAKCGYDSKTGYGLNASAAAGGSLGRVTSAVEYGDVTDNIGAKADVSVGKAAANASAGINYNDGNFSAGIKGGAEVTALDVGGDITGTFGGIEGSVGGSVKLGSIGAGANFGYKDGKLDIGANLSLGIGASVHASVDVGSFVSTAKNVWNFLKARWF